MGAQETIQILAAGAGSVCFALIFSVRGSKLITVGWGGALAWLIFLVGKQHGSALLGLFEAVTVAAAIAEMEARRRKTPVIVMELPLLIPLLPGGDLYRMMVSIMQNGVLASMPEIVWLVQEVFIIAAGIILVSTIVSVYMKIRQRLCRSCVRKNQF